MMVFIVAVQVVLPLTLIAWLAFLPARSLAGLGLQAACSPYPDLRSFLSQ
jgi:hypothetical protein